MPAVRSAFDVAFWLADTALNANEYLQPQKMHRLMFLAQAYFAVAFNGKPLMPAMFVADEMGPIEPNIFAAFSRGRPDVDVELFLPEEVEGFLDSIWRRFGHFSVDKLTRMTKETAAYQNAFQRAPRSEITLESMRLAFTRAEETPGVDRVVKPKVLRTQSGRPVTVQSWTPRAVDPKKVQRAPTLKPEDLEGSGQAATSPMFRAWNPEKAEPPTADPLANLSPKERIRLRQQQKAERKKAIKTWAPRVIKRSRGEDDGL